MPLYTPIPGPGYVCTSATRPSAPFEGQQIYETDTDLVRVYTGAAWKIAFDKLINYTESTADLVVTATTAPVAQTAISSGAVTYLNDPICIEFYCHRVDTGASANAAIVVNLWDDSTDLGRLARYATPAAAVAGTSCFVRRFLTPTAASHTYIVKAWRVTADGNLYSGAGGVDGELPSYLRISYVGAL